MKFRTSTAGGARGMARIRTMHDIEPAQLRERA
jgi:hypothetical protein